MCQLSIAGDGVIRQKLSSSVCDPSLCVCGSWMYWTDWEEDEVNDSIGRIEKAWMDGSNRRIFVTSNMLWPNGLTLDHSTSTMYWCDAYYDHIERIYLNGTGRRVSAARHVKLNLSTGFSCDS